MAVTDTGAAVVVTSPVCGVVVVTSLVGGVVVVTIPVGNVVEESLEVMSVVGAVVLTPVAEMVVGSGPAVVTDTVVEMELPVVDWVPGVVVDRPVSSLQDMRKTAKNENRPNIRIFFHMSFI